MEVDNKSVVDFIFFFEKDGILLTTKQKTQNIIPKDKREKKREPK